MKHQEITLLLHQQLTTARSTLKKCDFGS